MRILYYFVYFVFSLLILAGTVSSASSENSEDEKLNAYFQEQWEWIMKESPTIATIVGDYRYNDQLDDYSLAAEERREQHERESLKNWNLSNRSSTL